MDPSQPYEGRKYMEWGAIAPAIRRPAQGRATDGTGLNMLMAASFRT